MIIRRGSLLVISIATFLSHTLAISMANFKFSSEIVVLEDSQLKNSPKKDVFEALESKFSWFLAGDTETTPEL